MKARFLLTLVLAFSAYAVLAQGDLTKVKIKAIPVATNLYFLQFSGAVVGNIGVFVGPSGTLLVDDGYAPLAGKIEAAVQRLNPGKIKFVLNTHFHNDHTGGNAAFAEEGAIIIAQSEVRARLAGDIPNTPDALPGITFDQSMTLHSNNEDVKLVHYGPGHSDGDCIVYFKNTNVVHMGDHFFNFGYPFIDLRHGGHVDGYLQTLNAVLDTVPADAKIIPGHGRLTSVADLKRYHDLLAETADYVRQSMGAGKTLQQLQTDGLPEKWKNAGGDRASAARWIETVYNDVTRQ
jgi:glyoxylase-like metal-dependent hydrolase (beta-lactamase superfamily II)